MGSCMPTGRYVCWTSRMTCSSPEEGWAGRQDPALHTWLARPRTAAPEPRAAPRSALGSPRHSKLIGLVAMNALSRISSCLIGHPRHCGARSSSTGSPGPGPCPRTGNPMAQAGSIPRSLPRILRTALEVKSPSARGPRDVRSGYPGTHPPVTVPKSPRANTQGFFPIWGYHNHFLSYVTLYHGLYLFSVFCHQLLPPPPVNNSASTASLGRATHLPELLTHGPRSSRSLQPHPCRRPGAASTRAGLRPRSGPGVTRCPRTR